MVSRHANAENLDSLVLLSVTKIQNAHKYTLIPCRTTISTSNNNNSNNNKHTAHSRKNTVALPLIRLAHMFEHFRVNGLCDSENVFSD